MSSASLIEDEMSEKMKNLQSLLSTLITTIGNFSVQYNFQCISVALIAMSQSQCTADDDACRDGEQDDWVQSTASATVFEGAIIGQLSMGYVGDAFGRSLAMTLTLSLVSLGAVCSAAIPFGSATAVYSIIIVSRFILGVGVGGVYPLAATKAAEDSNSEEELAKAINELFQQPTKKQDLIARGYHLLESYSWKKMAERLAQS